MASPSVTYTFSNATVASATEVNQNFTDLINGITDGTKDLSISALTVAGNFSATGSTNTIGNASSDDFVLTASLASAIAIKTTATYDVGSSTLGIASIYFGRNSQTVRLIGHGSMSATWTFTMPVNAGTANYALITDGSGVTSWSAWSISAWAATTSALGTVYLPNGQIRMYGGNASGGSSSGETHIANHGTLIANTGTAITRTARTTTTAEKYTVNEAGVYALSTTWYHNAAALYVGLSVNSNQLSTSIISITNADILAVALSDSAMGDAALVVATTVRLAANDVVRVHLSAVSAWTSATDPSGARFTMTQCFRTS